MRHGGGRLARQHYYDRNPVDVGLGHSQDAIAPHAQTTRATYTVPNGKKAFIEMAQIDCHRDTAATTAGQPQADIAITPVGGAGFIMGIAKLRASENAAKDSVHRTYGATALLLAGDVLNQRTSDDSTGGTVSYEVRIKMTEFDA